GDVLSSLNGVHAYQISPNRDFSNPLVSDQKIKAISSLHDWRYEYLQSSVKMTMLREVWGEVLETEDHYTEYLPYLLRSSNMTLARSMRVTNGSFFFRSDPKRVLAPLRRPQQYLLHIQDLNELKELTGMSSHMFAEGWGCHNASKKKTTRFPVTIVRCLQYFFHMGKEVEIRHMNPKVICFQLAQFIREKKIKERAITEQQIKSWVSSEKRRNNSKPGWFRAGDPTCIWENCPTEQSQSETGNESDVEETEREPRLLLRFPVHIYNCINSLQTSSI
ncbi:MAG: hypothetical protein Q8M03_05510, partial [Legionella sp.]|nr:hypothetical protein [Legionella sp.]